MYANWKSRRESDYVQREMKEEGKEIKLPQLLGTHLRRACSRAFGSRELTKRKVRVHGGASSHLVLIIIDMLHMFLFTARTGKITSTEACNKVTCLCGPLARSNWHGLGGH